MALVLKRNTVLQLREQCGGIVLAGAAVLAVTVGFLRGEVDVVISER